MQPTKDLLLSDFLAFLVEEGRVKSPKMGELAIRSLQKARGRELTISDINKTVLCEWVERMLTSMKLASAKRYIESVSVIYKHANVLGVVDDANLFDAVRQYADNVCSEGVDKFGVAQVENIRRLAASNALALKAELKEDGEAKPTAEEMAIDAYLFAFYNAGAEMADVVNARHGDAKFCDMPQTAVIAKKYQAPIRKYVFPFEQNKRTPNKIRETIDGNFRAALKMRGIDVGDKTLKQFIVDAWIAAAKSAGVTLSQIRACCAASANSKRFAGIDAADLSAEQIDDIKREVANSVVDMTRHWYAIRFGSKEELVRREIEENTAGDYLNIYYPTETIRKKVKKRIVKEERPTIRNIMFVQTVRGTLDKIIREKSDSLRYFAVKNKSTKESDYAIIPNAEMKKFMLFISNGEQVLTEDAVKALDIESGAYVLVTDGPYKGYRGRVMKVRKQSEQGEDVSILEIEADKFGSELAAICQLDKKWYLKVNSQLVESAQEI